MKGNIIPKPMISYVRYDTHSKLESYLTELGIRGLSVNYIGDVRELLSRYVSTVGEVSPETAIEFLSRYSDRSQNTKARYCTIIRGFLNFQGIPFDLRVKVPRQLPPFISQEEIDKLLDAIRAKRSHKGCLIRDLTLVETACKTGLRRTELANLRVRDIDFINNRLKVVKGKGSKDRVIPLVNGLGDKLEELCTDKKPDDRVFGLTARSLGMKISTWAKKAGVDLHTHSLRHYFGTTLADRGAHIRAIQELMGHSNLSATEVYISLTGRHLKEAISLFDE